MLFETTGAVEATAEPVLTAAELRGIQQLVRRLPIGEQVVEAILDLVRSARPGSIADKDLAEAIAWSPGPRASQALMLACRARALIDGRYAPSVDDVLALAEPVLQHRMALTFAARADDLTVRDVIARLKAKIG
jgi:MoxR-like ATPase